MPAGAFGKTVLLTPARNAVLSGGAVTAPGSDMASTKNYPTSTTISVGGGQANGTYYLLDGGDHNDAFGAINLPIPFPDALQEFSVQTSAIPASYGARAGAVVNIVTKSGTNEIHGDAFEFLRNGVTNSRNFFAATRDSLKRNQFGGTVGGPIRSFSADTRARAYGPHLPPTRFSSRRRMRCKAISLPWNRRPAANRAL